MRPCYCCGELKPTIQAVHRATRAAIVTTNKGGICRNCAETKAWCEECKDFYSLLDAPVGWAGPYKEGNPSKTFAIPCPTHSLSPTEPRVRCHSHDCTNDVKINGYSILHRYDYYGNAYCLRCWESTKNCSSCGKTAFQPEHTPGHTRQDDSYYCPRCSGTIRSAFPYLHIGEWERDYDERCACSFCTQYARQVLKIAQNDRYIEGDEECHNCGCYVPEIAVTTVEERDYCHACMYLLELPRCRQCHQYTNDDGDLGVCTECHNTDDYYQCNVGCGGAWFLKGTECRCDGVHRWNYTPPRFIMNHTPSEEKLKRPIYMGFELEVEASIPPATRRSGARWLRDAMPYAYPVHDGTLANDGQGGFEIVSHPFTLGWLRENWGSIASALSSLTSMGFRSWETKRCGMHIHISRAAMSDSHQMKFIRFIYGSTNLALAIGQRNYNDAYLTRYAPFHGEDRSRLIDKVKAYTNPGVRSHYTAISTNKPSTLEARWFRGTLNPDSFLKNIEFIHSVAVFTGIFGMVSANEANYIAWLRDRNHPNQYPTLLKYIEREYITRR